MEKKDFEAVIGKRFTVKSGSEVVELSLVSVDPLKRIEGLENVREEPFSLVFKGPGDAHLEDNSYEMSVEGGRDKVIFISAHRKDNQHIYYDAVFN